MKACNLQYVWKGISGYSYSYGLITNNKSLNDLITFKKTGGKIVLFGWHPTSYAAICALKNAGLSPDYVCDFTQAVVNDVIIDEDLILRDYKKLIKEPNCFYLIYRTDDYKRTEVEKYLQYHGHDDFGIVVEGFTKDFERKTNIQEAYFSAINELFDGSEITNETAFNHIKVASLNGAGYWDVALHLIYNKFKKAKGTKYLEIGPGIGVMSITLKKLIDLEETWITLPDEEEEWCEWRKPSSIKLIKEKYNISIQEGYIEKDNFTGKYDVIVLAQVMEHFVYNPVNTFKKLRELLTENGVILVCVPEEKKHYNVSSYKEMPNACDLTLEEQQKREKINQFGHFHEYSYKEAMEVFTESGLECVVHVETTPIHNFMLKRKE